MFFAILWPTWHGYPELTKTMCALPVPVHLQTSFTLKWVLVLCLHDTIAKFECSFCVYMIRLQNWCRVNFCSDTTTAVNSCWCDSHWRDIFLWWCHVNKYILSKDFSSVVVLNCVVFVFSPVEQSLEAIWWYKKHHIHWFAKEALLYIGPVFLNCTSWSSQQKVSGPFKMLSIFNFT